MNTKLEIRFICREPSLKDKKKKKGMIFTELTALFEWVDDETNDKYYIRI